MSDTSAPEAVSLQHYARLLRRRWPSLVLGVLVGLTLGLVWLQTAERQYEASATVTVTPITTDLFSGTPVNQLVNTATEAEIIRSTEVARRAAAIIQTESPGRRQLLESDPRDLLNALGVRVPLGSNALEISFTAGDPEAAADGANAFGTAYLDFRLASAENRRAAYLARLDDQLEELTAAFTALDTDSDERASIAEEIATVRQQIGDATLLTLTPGELVSEALPPRFAASPRAVIALPGGLLLGILLGIGFAAIRHRVDDRILTADELEYGHALPVMGSLPALDRTIAPGTVDDELALTAERVHARTRHLTPWTVLVARADPPGPTHAEPLASALRRRGQLRVVAADPRPGAPPQHGPHPLLVDGGNLTTLADVVASGHDVNAIVLVVELGVTRASAVARATHELTVDSRGRPLVGALVLERARTSYPAIVRPLLDALPARQRPTPAVERA